MTYNLGLNKEERMAVLVGLAYRIQELHTLATRAGEEADPEAVRARIKARSKVAAQLHERVSLLDGYDL